MTSRFFLCDSLFAITITVLLLYAAVFSIALIANGDLLILPWTFVAGMWLAFAALFM